MNIEMLRSIEKALQDPSIQLYIMCRNVHRRVTYRLWIDPSIFYFVFLLNIHKQYRGMQSVLPAPLQTDNYMSHSVSVSCPQEGPS
jgi:hypothetical protein